MLNFLRRKPTRPDPVRASAPEPPKPVREPRAFDYTSERCGWGHNIVIHHVAEDGQVRVSGWGDGIEEGDHLLIDYGGQRQRFTVAEIEYHRDPPDMWAATLTPPTKGAN
ncbi:hypothetical protein [Streptomyces cylindrosporus]|uniref:Uncharacterized protein n=1 Tax=Streptomyces cylindrosporus TaxID=2927583 RepID=A0ABS9YM08_9ACTN|nr:hypothetical protein [Streptomyces cylindrosporus]MCI3277585.1 hypothetical protein [Streptomyces cylindrosporus]